MATVTVAMTAFDAERTIERALKSALAQTLQPLEILVVDDGSTDGTTAVVERMAIEHPLIRLIRHDGNLGVAMARNSLVAEAKGDVLAFFDDDDESLPRRLDVQLHRILDYETRTGTDLILCHTARRQVFPKGRRHVEAAVGSHFDVPAPHGMDMVQKILAGKHVRNGHGTCATSSQMARVSTYRALGGFDAAFRRYEDTDFCVRLAAAGGHFVGIPEPLVTQYMTVSDDKQLEIELNYARAMVDKHRALFASSDEWAFSRAWLELKYMSLANRKGPFAAGLSRLMLQRPLSVMMRAANAIPMTRSRAARRKLHARTSPPGRL
ncbi:glycosyltransferase family 2 protein [Asticcacaulis solisilvae]|uniref:glycosyltransferase family 2 protein n=1 Tax=Asticcacaulis solisilvae TaxID=1217274 RepID=UPI003FD7FC24